MGGASKMEYESEHHHTEIILDPNLLDDAYDGENTEHAMGMWAAVKQHSWAYFWNFTICFTIVTNSRWVIESFDMFLNGNFVALTAFQKRYDVELPDGKLAIPTKWQSALFQSGQCGTFVGLFLAEPITNRIDYRWTTILGLFLVNAVIFISFFAQSFAVLTVGQALKGVPWGLFIADAPAHSGGFPLVLRGATSAALHISWSIGVIIVTAATLGYNKRDDERAWGVPLALQWIFPHIDSLLVLLFLAPKSPWWLVRKGRKEEVQRYVERLDSKDEASTHRTLAMMERTVEIKLKLGGTPTLKDLLKGAGISSDRAFDLNLINSCLGFIAKACFWLHTNWFDHRTIYLYGTAVSINFMMILGVCASVSQNYGANYSQAVLGILISVFVGAMGPVSYTIISETSSVRFHTPFTVIGRAACYFAETPMIYLASKMLSPASWNLVDKCGYVWGGTAIVCWTMEILFSSFAVLSKLLHES
ncbi:maltose permease [Calycina marina]|uniref:Maltose permease n=1 Tax=Calycina marina TaxID=1763456 RepID=A0A9P8CF41_9HELO|nr:maltose permease [Calycina marina]